jgi:hypothetical protein
MNAVTFGRPTGSKPPRITIPGAAGNCAVPPLATFFPSMVPPPVLHIGLAMAGRPLRGLVPGCIAADTRVHARNGPVGMDRYNLNIYSHFHGSARSQGFARCPLSVPAIRVTSTHAPPLAEVWQAQPIEQ